jgi:clan AA aspartic protease
MDQTQIGLGNPLVNTVDMLTVDAVTDSAVLLLCIPENIQLQLKLKELNQRQVVMADGKTRTVLYVGPVQIKYKDRNCFSGALVFGDEVLLGSIPMTELSDVPIPA